MSWNNVIPAWMLVPQPVRSRCCDAEVENKMSGPICTKCRMICFTLELLKKEV